MLVGTRPPTPMVWQTTETVLQRLRDYDNREAWQSFADRFRRPVVSFAKSMGLAPADAEDVAQETLIAFAEAYRLGRYDPAKGKLSQFLFGIAYRQALRVRSARVPAKGVNVAQAATTFWAKVPEDEQTASGVWDLEWERILLERCLDQARAEFEPQTFRAFELTVREERPPAEAAAALGVPLKSVYNAKHRVLKRLRELREDYETHAG
jgi:RNA polymerase sigma-70 factor, ECF subfamily